MAKYTPKAARERGERFENSWQENSPDNKWSDMTLEQFKTGGTEIEGVEQQIVASQAHTKSLQILRDNKIKERMETCDFIAADVEGDRNFGPDSALYGGFGYIRKSDKKKGGGRKKTP